MSKKAVVFSIVLFVLITLIGSDVCKHDMALSAVAANRAVTAAKAADSPAAPEYLISAYDDVMRRVGEEEGQDWLLMSAIAYSESRFESDLVSKQGAIGLMQVMPIVGKQFNVAKERIMDPETNIRLAGKLLNEIDDMLNFSPSTPANDRLSIILACYNGGIGHVSDARRLARSNGEDPNSWEVVARYLDMKADPAVYESELVRYGKFTGSRQTKSYVREVMQRYDTYRKMVAGRS